MTPSTRKTTSKPSTANKPVSKANTKTQAKKPVLSDVLKPKRVTFGDIKEPSDIGSLTADIAFLFDSRFTKGWDSKTFKILKDLPDIKTGEQFKEYASNSEQRYIVHYVGLFSLYRTLGYKAIERDTIKVNLDHLDFLKDTDYPKGLISWTLIKELNDIPKYNKSFKFQHLIRLHLVMLKHGVKLVK